MEFYDFCLCNARGGPLLIRYRRGRMSTEAIGTFIHPPLQVAITYHQHSDQYELQDFYYQPDQE